MLFAWQAQGFRYVSKCVAGARVREGCKNVGRRGGFEEARKRCVSGGRCMDFVLCDVDGGGLRRRIRGRVANFMSRKCYFAVIISRGSYTGLRMPRLNFFVAGAVLLKHPLENR